MASETSDFLAVDWNNGDTDALVPINEQLSLFLSARGPARDDNHPAVIIEAGMGDGLRSWSAVQALISKFARVYTYDRGGIGRSTSSPNSRTAANIGSELSDLLKAANITPPYVIVCHSYGGVLAREFLTKRPDDVIGMVFVDANTEKTLEERGNPFNALLAILGGLDYLAVTGLTTEHKLDPAQWAANRAEDAKNWKTAGEEMKAVSQSAQELASKNQYERQVLKDHPVVVIKGDTTGEFQRVYEAGVAAGNGTEEQRAEMRRILETLTPIEEKLQREQLRLSSSGRYMYATKSGHNVNLTEPELIAEEVKKVFQTLGYLSS